MKRKKLYYIFLFSPLVIIFLSLFVGQYSLSVKDVFGVFLDRVFNIAYTSQNKGVYIVWDIRIPRIVLGALVGASLATSGLAFQNLFKNPLVSSSVLGVSSGAGFGAALSIIIFTSSGYSFIFAFIFGLLAVYLSYNIGKVYSSDSTVMLVLGGVVVSSIFSSLTSLLKYIADPFDQLPTIVYWLMGSLASATYKDIYYGGAAMILGIIGIYLGRWRLNVLSMGDREAQALGVDLRINKGIIILSSSLATAGAVGVSGNIGWVGLIIPHICRMLFGTNNSYLVPASMSLGASYMILIDNLARSLTSGEIPLGVLTSLVGGPFFVYLLKKTRGEDI